MDEPRDYSDIYIERLPTNQYYCISPCNNNSILHKRSSSCTPVICIIDNYWHENKPFWCIKYALSYSHEDE